MNRLIKKAVYGPIAQRAELKARAAFKAAYDAEFRKLCTAAGEPVPVDLSGWRSETKAEPRGEDINGRRHGEWSVPRTKRSAPRAQVH